MRLTSDFAENVYYSSSKQDHITQERMRRTISDEETEKNERIPNKAHPAFALHQKSIKNVTRKAQCIISIML